MKSPSAADLSVFLCTAQHLNFSKAAVELGLTPSALSHSVKALENRLGVRLFNRTTRSVALTEAGERLYARLKPAFRDIDDALEDLNHFRDKPTGNLRITCGRQACELVLLPIASEFLQAYPDIRMEVVESEALLDIVAGGFDAGVQCVRWWSLRRHSLNAILRRKNPKICTTCRAFATATPVARCIAGSSNVTALPGKSRSADH
jgi:DNA-binding transcriptional LysR family regulator